MSNRMDELLDKLEGLGAIDRPELIEDTVASLRPEDVQALAVKWVRFALAKRVRGDVLAVERSAAKPAKVRAAPTPEMLEVHRRLDEEDARRHAQIQREFWDSMGAAMERLKADLRTEWTAELLESRFTLPDGTAVTWGTASADQHRERLEMFKRNAKANLEGAARHEQALEELGRTGAATLAEAVALTV